MTIKLKKLECFILLLCIVGIWYRPPCDTIACKRHQDKWLNGRYRDQFPLFLMPNNIQAIFTDKPPILEDTAKLVIDKLQNPPGKDKFDGNFRLTSCAVVGNSSNLLGSNYGKEIDKHTYVFRMNNAPVGGYEQDVGTRTTHHVVHFNHDNIRVYNNDATTILIVNEIGISHIYPEDKALYDKRIRGTLAYIATQQMPEQFAPFDITKDSDMMLDHFPANITQLPGRAFILHPQYLNYIDRRWFRPKDRKRGEYPSTGFKTLTVALHLCDYVDVFGFDTGGSPRWDHYYDAKGEMGWYMDEIPHRPPFQERLLKKLHNRDIIKLYHGNTSRKNKI